MADRDADSFSLLLIALALVCLAILVPFGLYDIARALNVLAGVK